jgi:hypothetical protein
MRGSHCGIQGTGGACGDALQTSGAAGRRHDQGCGCVGVHDGRRRAGIHTCPTSTTRHSPAHSSQATIGHHCVLAPISQALRALVSAGELDQALQQAPCRGSADGRNGLCVLAEELKANDPFTSLICAHAAALEARGGQHARDMIRSYFIDYALQDEAATASPFTFAAPLPLGLLAAGAFASSLLEAARTPSGLQSMLKCAARGLEEATLLAIGSLGSIAAREGAEGLAEVCGGGHGDSSAGIFILKPYSHIDKAAGSLLDFDAAPTRVLLLASAMLFEFHWSLGDFADWDSRRRVDGGSAPDKSFLGSLVPAVYLAGTTGHAAPLQRLALALHGTTCQREYHEGDYFVSLAMVCRRVAKSDSAQQKCPELLPALMRMYFSFRRAHKRGHHGGYDEEHDEAHRSHKQMCAAYLQLCSTEPAFPSPRAAAETLGAFLAHFSDSLTVPSSSSYRGRANEEVSFAMHAVNAIGIEMEHRDDSRRDLTEAFALSFLGAPDQPVPESYEVDKRDRRRAHFIAQVMPLVAKDEWRCERPKRRGRGTVPSISGLCALVTRQPCPIAAAAMLRALLGLAETSLLSVPR